MSGLAPIAAVMLQCRDWSKSAVLLSHDHHFDNLDNAGRALLPSVGVTYTTTSGAQRLGGNAVGLAPFETRSLEGRNGKKLFVTATPARHGPIGVDASDVVGFALGVKQPGDLVYTGAAEPRGRFHMTMGSEDALEAAHAFPDSALVAVHNEGWGHLRENQDQLVDVFAKFNLAHRLGPIRKGKTIAVLVVSRPEEVEGSKPSAPVSHPIAPLIGHPGSAGSC
jgi:hypothetical protein